MEIDMLSIGARIKAQRQVLHLTQTDIYEKCGIASGVLSRIENGKNVPSAIAFYKLSQVLECSMDWLLTGKSTNIQNYHLSDDEKTLLNGFGKLPKEDQNELLEILEIKLRKIIGKKATSM